VFLFSFLMREFVPYSLPVGSGGLSLLWFRNSLRIEFLVFFLNLPLYSFFFVTGLFCMLFLFLSVVHFPQFNLRSQSLSRFFAQASPHPLFFFFPPPPVFPLVAEARREGTLLSAPRFGGSPFWNFIDVFCPLAQKRESRILFAGM